MTANRKDGIALALGYNNGGSGNTTSATDRSGTDGH
jgi:hypothetical protein